MSKLKIMGGHGGYRPGAGRPKGAKDRKPRAPRWDSREAWLRSFLEEHPADAHARLSLARRLVARGEVDEAIAQIRRVFDAHPGSLDAHVALGRLLLSERRDPEAIKEFAEVLEVLERRALAAGAP